MSKKTLHIKQSKKKMVLTEQLNKVPVVQLACERTDVSRATFYRWKKVDRKFAEAVDEAIASGAALINDLAESKLIAAIKEGNMTGIIYWLKHRHPAYATRVELSLNKPQLEEKLTPEEQKMVQQALKAVPLPEITEGNEQSHEPTTKK